MLRGSRILAVFYDPTRAADKIGILQKHGCVLTLAVTLGQAEAHLRVNFFHVLVVGDDVPFQQRRSLIEIAKKHHDTLLVQLLNHYIVIGANPDSALQDFEGAGSLPRLISAHLRKNRRPLRA